MGAALRSAAAAPSPAGSSGSGSELPPGEAAGLGPLWRPWPAPRCCQSWWQAGAAAAARAGRIARTALAAADAPACTLPRRWRSDDESEAGLERLLEVAGSSQRIVVFSGSGLSASSGAQAAAEAPSGPQRIPSWRRPAVCGLSHCCLPHHSCWVLTLCGHGVKPCARKQAALLRLPFRCRVLMAART